MGLGAEIKQGFQLDLEREAARKIIRVIEDWRQGGKIRTAQRRWIFELIQNALDVYKQRRGTAPLKIELVVQDDRIKLRHNAGYFTPEEIRALIYAYSTKPYERESELAGKFAIGFLVTHIVSEKVDVRAVLNKDGELYEFSTFVDRKSNNVDVIFENFSHSFVRLDRATKLRSDPGEYWTEYTYETADHMGHEAVDIGVSEVKKSLPFLLAFSEISEIRINGEEYKKEREGQASDHEVLVEKVGSVQVWVRKSQNEDVAIAVDTESRKVQNLSDIARIYIKGLPLVETGSYLQIPFTIHSARLETNPERDTLANIRQNKEIIEEALNLYYELAEYISGYDNMEDLHHLVDFRMVPQERIVQNPLWGHFNDVVRETVRKITQDVPLVETLEGRKEIINVVFPSKQVNSCELKPEVFVQFYDLLTDIRTNIPTRSELEGWVNLAAKLKAELADTVSVVLYGIEDLKNELIAFVTEREHLPKFEDFNTKYGISDSKRFLLSLFGIIDELYKQKVIESPKFVDYLLPDQAGNVGSLTWGQEEQLFRDEDIPEDFKQIVHKIGWEIRQWLLDRDFASFEIVKELVHDTMNVGKALEHLLKKHQPEGEIKEEAQWSDMVFGWIELFRWCVANKKLCKQFPVITKGGTVKQLEDLNSEALLIPFKHMGVNHEFEDVYPEGRILHRRYFDIDNPKELVKALEQYKAFITDLPSYNTDITLGYNKLKTILTPDSEISKVDHKMVVQLGTVSILPFWSDIIGGISANQQQGKLFFRFVVQYLINKDENWGKQVQVSCSCKDKSHNIIPSQWLASLKADAWVPLRTQEGESGEEKVVPREATKESIENLLSREELEELIKSNPEKICRLLPHIRGFDELDLKIKLQSIEKGVPEENVRKEVSALVDITKVVPELSEIANRDISAFKEAIAKLKQTLEQKPIKDENQKIGKNLEKLIKKIIEDKHFKVEPIYKGGDLEMWPIENEGWDSGLIEIEPYLIEIKFTSGARAHLSRLQSQIARDKKKNYVILVVENVELREQLKVEMNEGAIPEELVTAVIGNSHIIDGIGSKLGSIPNPEEVEPDIHGYWLKRKLWTDKDDILTWIDQKFR